MKVLLDTHAWLWMMAEPERLSPASRELLASAETAVHVSAASAWEIGIKHALGRLPLPAPPEDLVPFWLQRSNATALPIDMSHVLAAAALPNHHRDPFDRVLIAQSRLERLPLLTADPQFDAYEVEVLKA